MVFSIDFSWVFKRLEKSYAAYMLLNAQNYKAGFLIDDEFIGGVTEMADGLYSAYVSHYLTGETLAYQEFERVEPALEFLASLPQQWAFEAVGCSTHAKKTSSGCGTSTAGTLGASESSIGGCKNCSCG
jgi:hypothetical protein